VNLDQGALLQRGSSVKGLCNSTEALKRFALAMRVWAFH